MHVNVTPRRRAEAERDRAIRLARIASRLARMGGWYADLASERVEWSDEVAAIHDMPPGTRPKLDEGLAYYPPEWRGRLTELFGACARDGVPYDAELEIVTARGVRKWVRAIGEPVRDETGRNGTGRIVAVQGAFQDLTPQKEAEAALVLSERRFQQLAETLPQIVWTAEPDGTVDYASPDFYRLTGLGRLDLAARQWIEALHPDDHARCLVEWTEAVARGAEYRLELRLRAAAEDGYRWHLVSARPVRDAAGAIVKWYGSAIDIHDRRLAEEALAEAQRQNAMLLAAAGEGVAGLDSEMRVSYANPAALAMLGYEAGELIGRRGHPLFHHSHADGRPYPIEACPAYLTLRDGTTRHVEGEVLFRKDGTALPVEYTVAPMLDEAGGAVAGAVVTFRDVTEKQRAEALRATEARVLEMVGADRPLAEVLDEIARAADALIQGAMSSILLVEDGRLRNGAAPGLPAAYIAAIDGLAVGPEVGSCGTAAHEGRRVIATDLATDPLWAGFRDLAARHGLGACWATPVEDAEGRVLATFAIYYAEPGGPAEAELALVARLAQFARVAIERTRQREELRASEERFRIVARATSDVLWDWDAATDRIWWSDGLRQQFGHDPGGPVTDFAYWAERVHPEDLPRVRETALAVLSDPAASYWETEYRFRRAGGAWAQAIDRGNIIRDAEGRPVRMVGSIVDVTAQRRLEAELHQAQRLEAIGKLTGGVAHDFNNLLTVILGSAELLEEELGDDHRLRMLAEMARSAAQRGAELTARLLAFARRQPLDPQPTDVNRQVGEMDALLRRALGGQVELEVVRAGGLWRAMIDPAQLESALLNLAINARDAMPEGGRLTLESANAHLDAGYAARFQEVIPGQYVMVSVSDTGEGMDAETAARAFEPFFTTKEVGKGSGLGLSQVYGFVKQSSGHVRIYSEPGQGTTVKLYLPRAPRGAGDVAGSAPEVVEVDGGGEHILMVEDDALVRAHVAAQLAELGYRVIPAGEGAEALALLESDQRVDLLFTDVVMPGGMSGRELAEAALRLRPGLPVLYTSGYSENAILHHGRLDPGVHLLQKPYRRQDLAQRLRLVLDAGSEEDGWEDCPG